MATRSRPISPEFLFYKTLALFVFWILLSGSFELIHLELGLVCSFAVAWMNSGHSPFVPKFRLWFGIILYLPWLLLKIIQSSIHLSKLILHPKLPIAPRFIPVESKLRHHAAMVLLGNSITLTPGTITTEIEGNKILVHAMDNDSSVDDDIKAMESKIANIFKDEKPDL